MVTSNKSLMLKAQQKLSRELGYSSSVNSQDIMLRMEEQSLPNYSEGVLSRNKDDDDD